MKKLISYFTLLNCILLSSCMTVTYQESNFQRYTGDFRYHANIAEFFDCKTLKKHYLGKDGQSDDLIQAYQKLNLKPKEDVYVRVEGYYKEEEQMDGVDPIDVFVPTKIIQLDSSRSCKRPHRLGL